MDFDDIFTQGLAKWLLCLSYNPSNLDALNTR